MFLTHVRLKAQGSGLRARGVIGSVLLTFAISACGSSEPATIPAPPDVAAPPAGSLKTTSGLSTKVLQPGTGTRHPRPTDRVRVHYTGWTTDGKMFDSSVVKNQASEFALNQVIPGWTEGLQLMVEGEKRRFWIPSNLAYEGQPDKPQGMLVFDVDLIRIQ
jgi:peptidylprolyl isomerase